MKILILGGSSDISKELIKNLDLNRNYIYLHYNKNRPKISSKKISLIKKNFALLDKKNFNKSLKIFKNFDIIINLVGYIDNKSYYESDYDNLIKSLNANFLAPLFIIKNSINHMKKKKFWKNYKLLKYWDEIWWRRKYLQLFSFKTLFRLYSKRIKKIIK